MDTWEMVTLITSTFVTGILATSCIFQKVLETAKLRKQDEL